MLLMPARPANAITCPTGQTEVNNRCVCPTGQIAISIPVDDKGTSCIPKNTKSDQLKDNPIFFYLSAILRFLAAGVGLAVAGGIVWGGILYITARGNSAQTEKGKVVILNAIIGLILFALMYAILGFLIPGSIFS